MKNHILKGSLIFGLTFLFICSSSAQGTYNACQVTTTTDQTGTYFDSGGPTGAYLDNENCTLLVAPSCAVSITLTFTSFSTESGYDYFSVYDGQTTAAPAVLPPTSGTLTLSPVTCTSGYMLIIWRSDLTVTAPGWEAHWTSVIASSSPPTAQFLIGDSTPPLNTPVQFTDQSSGSPDHWVWDFGDGDTSHAQNPLHAFANPGPYTVMLTAFTCNDSDTTSQSIINVQTAPQINVYPDSLNASAICGDSVTFNLDITNSAVGGGQLVYNTGGTFNQVVRVLMMTYGSDQFSEYQHTKNAIGYHFSNYILTETTTINPAVLTSFLIGKNVLVIPEQEYGDTLIWAALGPVIRQFLINGGSVIWCGSNGIQSKCMFAADVFHGTFNMGTIGTVTVVNPGHPLAFNLPATFIPPSLTYSVSISDTDNITIASATGNQQIICTRPYFAGKAIYLGFDYYVTNSTNPNGQALGNAVEWGGQNGLPSWLSVDITSDTVDTGSTSTIQVTFQTAGLNAGTYTGTITIHSNDPNQPAVAVPCSFTITGNPAIALSDTCVDFGAPIMQYSTASRTFQVYNTGCDTLFISNVTSDSVQYTVTQFPSYVLPGDSGDVTVSFSSPTFPGPFLSHLRIYDNDVDTVLCLSASTYIMAAITINPPLIAANVAPCGDSATTSFSIGNSGGSSLNYAIAPTPAWLNVNPANGTILPGDSALIRVDMNSGTFAGGLISTNIQVNSNDPLTPTTILPANMTVGYNPCGNYSFLADTCQGKVTFTSSIVNGGTFYWDFGDSDTSSAINPIHFYEASGTHQCTLIVDNGTPPAESIIQPVQSVIHGPRAANCYPMTNSYCCGTGIVHVVLSGVWNSIDKNSNNASDGYSDYTCTDTTSLLIGIAYTLNVTTGITNPENVKAWIDFNDDGIFIDSPVGSGGERIMDHTGTTIHQQFFIVPVSALIYPITPRRMRIMSDGTGNPVPNPCLDLTNGQAEDYTVFIHDPDSIVSVTDTFSLSSFNVYPNPFTANVILEYNIKFSGQVSAEVYDVLGIKVKSFALEELQTGGVHSYQFETASAGIYYVKLTVDGMATTKKIVKM